MDKDLDCSLYSEITFNLSPDYPFSQRKKVFHTRIIKLSAKERKYSSVEIGAVSFESRQFQRSLVQIKRATIIDPGDWFTQVFMAKILFKLEKDEEAISTIKKVMCVDPKFLRAHDAIIERFKEQKKLEDLDSYYQNIAETFTDPTAIENLYYASAQTFTRYDEDSKALKIYRKIYKVNPNASYTFSYALALYQEGEYEEARTQFQLLKGQNPGHRLFTNNTAYITYCMGRLQQAYEEFEEIIANRLVSPETYSNFLLVLYHLDKDEAVINRYKDLLQQYLGQHGPRLESMYKEALKTTQKTLEKDNMTQEKKEFNLKKIHALNFVLSFIN